MLTALLLLAQAQVLSAGSANPQSGPASLTSLTVGMVDAGTVWLGNGSAAAPALAFSDDPDTGLNRPGANQLSVSTGGVQALVISAATLNATQSGATLYLTSVPVLAATTPTISSGFGTSPSVTAGKAYAFRVNVGTGGTASSGVVAVGATATTGWNCTCTDVTTASATVFLCKQTANTTTTVTVGNFDAAGAAAAWTASDILAVSCVGF